MKVRNKWVWITGASSGIGRALAIEFSRRGANLVLLARDRARLQETADACAQNTKIIIREMDLSVQETMELVCKSLAEEGVPVDILVNNGGISQRSLALETEDFVSRKIFEINFFGTIFLTKLLLPRMIQAGGGQIAVITSLVGKIGSPKRTTYAASKHALHGYYDSLRAELYQDNIRVTLLCPGFIRTNISYSAVTGDGSSQNTMDTKTGNGMDPARLAIKAVSGIEREREEVYIGRSEILAIYLKRWVPGIFSRILRKVKVT
jgi:short-subunit dehydrogenase